MIYFISAWYNGDDWKEREEPWYIAKHISEFDDTIKQVQLFSRNNLYPYKIILLSYAPNFRHFLHRQSIFRAEYWSVFDQMQCIESKTQRPFLVKDVPWPDGVEFIESPFFIIVRKDGEKYARISFGDDGNMLTIEYYETDVISRIEHFDDRGFISMMEIYEDGKALYEQYLDEEGVWKFNRYLSDGHVEINPVSNYFLWPEGKKEYKHLSYDNIVNMIEEVLIRYVNRTDDQDIFCVAMDKLHTELMARILRKRKTILSFFEGRTSLMKNDLMQRFLQDAGYIVTDTRENADLLRRTMGRAYPRMISITPYDSRVDHGISMEFPYQNILVMADDLEKEQLNELLDELLKYVNQNYKTKVNLYTATLDYQKVMYFNDCAGRMNQAVTCEDKSREFFTVVRCMDAMETNRKLRETRVLIDIQNIPNQFVQISALSMGIPQITMRETQYVKNGRNGHVIESINEINEWLAFYLKDISNWNHARVESYEMGSEFSTAEIKRLWTQVIRHVENNWS